MDPPPPPPPPPPPLPPPPPPPDWDIEEWEDVGNTVVPPRLPAPGHQQHAGDGGFLSTATQAALAAALGSEEAAGGSDGSGSDSTDDDDEGGGGSDDASATTAFGLHLPGVEGAEHATVVLTDSGGGGGGGGGELVDHPQPSSSPATRGSTGKAGRKGGSASAKRMSTRAWRRAVTLRRATLVAQLAGQVAASRVASDGGLAAALRDLLPPHLITALLSTTASDGTRTPPVDAVRSVAAWVAFRFPPAGSAREVSVRTVAAGSGGGGGGGSGASDWQRQLMAGAAAGLSARGWLRHMAPFCSSSGGWDGAAAAAVCASRSALQTPLHPHRVAVLLAAALRAFGVHARLIMSHDPPSIRDAHRLLRAAARAGSSTTRAAAAAADAAPPRRVAPLVSADMAGGHYPLLTDVWVEALCAGGGGGVPRWVPVDVVRGWVDDAARMARTRPRTAPFTVVLAVSPPAAATAGTTTTDVIRDVSPRYAERWSEVAAARLAGGLTTSSNARGRPMLPPRYVGASTAVRRRAAGASAAAAAAAAAAGAATRGGSAPAITVVEGGVTYTLQPGGSDASGSDSESDDGGRGTVAGVADWLAATLAACDPTYQQAVSGGKRRAAAAVLPSPPPPPPRPRQRRRGADLPNLPDIDLATSSSEDSDVVEVVSSAAKPIGGAAAAAAAEAAEAEAAAAAPLREPFPTSMGAYARHRQYALARWLEDGQVLHPHGLPGAPAAVPVLGYFKGAPIYPRAAVHTCKGAEQWLRQDGREVLPECRSCPAAIITLRAPPPGSAAAAEAAARGGSSTEARTLPVYGVWQTRVVAPPPYTGGPLPRNAHGNYELWGGNTALLPDGLAYVACGAQPRLFADLAAAGIEAVRAVTGFTLRNDKRAPVIGGIIVASAHAPLVAELTAAAAQARRLADATSRHATIVGRWERLTRGLLIRARVRRDYGTGGGGGGGGGGAAASTATLDVHPSLM